MYTCPHCNKSGISFSRRAQLGPAVPATCVTCGGKIGVPYGKSMIAMAPFIGSIMFAPFAPNPASLGFALVAGMVAMFVLFFKFVPLIKK